MDKGKQAFRAIFVALLSCTMLVHGISYATYAEPGDIQDPEIYVSEEQEIILSEEVAGGDIVAGAIKEIIEATGQMDLADETGVERLQEYISSTKTAFQELTEEEQGALSESIELLDHAAASVDNMQDAMTQLEETGTFEIEQTGLPNSWRFMDGVRIEEALDTVDGELQNVTEILSESSTEENAETAPEEVVPEETLPEEPEVEVEEGAAEDIEQAVVEPVTPGDAEEVVEEGIVDLSEMTELTEEEIAEMATVTLPAGALDGMAGTLTASSEPLKGIDISRWNWNKPIEWTKVKNAVDFIIIQCGYGNDEVKQDDRRWAESVAACEKYGIPYGVYLYSYATDEKMIDSEVAHTLRLLKGHKPSFPVYLDLEENAQRKLGNAKLSALASRYCSKIKAAGYKTGVYSSTSWWNDYLHTFAKDSNFYYHWVAHWAPKCGYKGRYEMWQYSENGTVSGMTGYVDMNYWYGEQYSSVDYGLYEIVSTIDTNYALDISGASMANGGNLQLYRRNNTFAQKFYVIPMGFDNRYQIVNANSGKYLDVKSNGRANGTNVWQYEGNDTDAQVFRITDTGNGNHKIEAVSSGKCVDVSAGKAANGTNVQIYTDNNTAAQKWRFVKTADRLPTSGVYEILSSLDRDYALDVSGSSLENGANVQLYERNGTNAQRFQLIPLGYNDLYYIRSYNSGKNIDINANGTANGTNVQQYTPNATNAQIFKIVAAEGGTYEIRGLGSGKNIDLSGATVKNKTNIQIYEGNGTGAQRWFFEKVF